MFRLPSGILGCRTELDSVVLRQLPNGRVDSTIERRSLFSFFLSGLREVVLDHEVDCFLVLLNGAIEERVTCHDEVPG